MVEALGGTHIFGRTGNVPLKWVGFLQGILKHGSYSLPKKSLNMGRLF